MKMSSRLQLMNDACREISDDELRIGVFPISQFDKDDKHWWFYQVVPAFQVIAMHEKGLSERQIAETLTEVVVRSAESAVHSILVNYKNTKSEVKGSPKCSSLLS